MILSNTAIIDAIKANSFSIENLAGEDPSKPPFNTSAVDFRLGSQISILKEGLPASFDLRKAGLAQFLANNSRCITLQEESPYALKPGKFILGQTMEKVSFPLLDSDCCYSARVEGESSLARCGILVHFTAPTIHARFAGPITLEIINLGPLDFLLYPGMYFCQLIIEQVSGRPTDAPNQFKGQTDPAGRISA